MKLSICMATHNGGRFLREQMDSILNQLKADDELIISDDNSFDDTIEIIQACQDNRIKLLRSKKFNSPAKNFEHALASCKNEIIFLADQDDVWHLNKIKVMTEALTDTE